MQATHQNSPGIPYVQRLIHYTEYEVLMLSGVFFYHQLLFTLLYAFNWKYIVLWTWLSLQQFFYYHRSYDRLEIYRRIKWYHGIPYWLFTFGCIYLIYARVSLIDYLNSAGK